MSTRYIVVQPLFSVDVADGEPAREPSECLRSPAVSSGPICASEPVGANGQILMTLASLLQKALQNAPQLIAEISTLIALFGGKAPAAATDASNG
jgi:hypothetical protein